MNDFDQIDRIVLSAVNPIFSARVIQGLRPMILRMKRDRYTSEYQIAEMRSYLYSKRSWLEDDPRKATVYADLAETWAGIANVIYVSLSRVTEEIAHDVDKQISDTRKAVLLGHVRP